MAFLGSPEPAAVALDALVGAGHDVKLVVTRPDKRRGRGGAVSATPVKETAARHGLTVTSDPAAVTAAGAELGVVVAYGRIIRPDILAALPMVNVHFSLLPRWRGAAPVERAILAGDRTTGVCLMDVEEGLDTGAVYRRAETAIGPDDTAAGLTARLAGMGAELLVRALDEGLGQPVPQAGEVTYAAKIEPEDLHLDWARPAVELHRVVRIGRAWTTWQGRRLLVLAAHPVEAGDPGAGGGATDRAGSATDGDGTDSASRASAGGRRPGTIDGATVATGQGGLRLELVQPEGRRPMPAADW
ncbi:MAG TPA: methionyl-tRNA formyltransferase, partial [Acidimicrobiales bacterium]|nr:methionyl-tRNA formyltransferase [Acidimicrobiales bacterium]